MSINFGGKWNLAGSENYEQFLEEMNIPKPIQEKLMSATDLEISHEGDTIKYLRKRGDDVLDIVITIGQKYTENTYGHTEVRIPHWEGDTLEIKAAEGDGHWTTSIAIVDGQLVATDTSHGGVSGTRIYKKV